MSLEYDIRELESSAVRRVNRGARGLRALAEHASPSGLWVPREYANDFGSRLRSVFDGGVRRGVRAVGAGVLAALLVSSCDTNGGVTPPPPPSRGPVVEVVSPVSGGVYTSPLEVVVDASSPGGLSLDVSASVNDVVVCSWGSAPVGSAPVGSAPYECTVDIGLGDFVFSAQAVDSDGLSASDRFDFSIRSDPGPDPDPDPVVDPTLPPSVPSGMSASQYWNTIEGHSDVDVSIIVAGSDDNSVSWFLDWLDDRMKNPTCGPRFCGEVGMIPEVAQTYVVRFGGFGNISDQSRLAIETYFDARDRLTQTVDLRTEGPYIHPDAYVSGWDVGLWYPHHGSIAPGEDGDVWYPVYNGRPEDTGLLPNERFSAVAFTDLNPEPNTSISEQDKIDNWLSLAGWDLCSWNATQDYPENAPGFEFVVDTGYADSFENGFAWLSAFQWPLRVVELRGRPGNTTMHLRADSIDRALWDADHMYVIAAHLGPSPVRYEGWEYDDDHGVPAVGQLIPPMMHGDRTVISSVSTELSSRFVDARILADPDFGESRKYHPTDPLAEFAAHHLVSPFDMRLSKGKRLGISDGGRVHRPVWDPSDPSSVYDDRFDNRVVSPCSNSPFGLVYLPDDLTMR